MGDLSEPARTDHTSECTRSTRDDLDTIYIVAREAFECLIRDGLCLEIESSFECIFEYFGDLMDLFFCKCLILPPVCRLELCRDLLTRLHDLFSESEDLILPS